MRCVLRFRSSDFYAALRQRKTVRPGGQPVVVSLGGASTTPLPLVADSIGLALATRRASLSAARASGGSVSVMPVFPASFGSLQCSYLRSARNACARQSGYFPSPPRENEAASSTSCSDCARAIAFDKREKIESSSLALSASPLRIQSLRVPRLTPTRPAAADRNAPARIAWTISLAIESVNSKGRPVASWTLILRACSRGRGLSGASSTLRGSMREEITQPIPYRQVEVD